MAQISRKAFMITTTKWFKSQTACSPTSLLGIHPDIAHSASQNQALVQQTHTVVFLRFKQPYALCSHTTHRSSLFHSLPTALSSCTADMSSDIAPAPMSQLFPHIAVATTAAIYGALWMDWRPKICPKMTHHLSQNGSGAANFGGHNLLDLDTTVGPNCGNH